MARTIRNAKIDSRSARARLSSRREPYWTVMAEGRALGYRKGKKGGTWIARWRDPVGKQHYQTLGAADDALDADGESILTCAQAQARARPWFDDQATAHSAGWVHKGPYTVKTALEDYHAWMESEGKRTVADSRTRAASLILPSLGKLEVTKLTTAQIRDWRDGLAEAPARLRTSQGEDQRFRETPTDEDTLRRRRSTANRTLTILKAALNHAFNEGRVPSDLAWRRVKPFKGVDGVRVRYLTVAEGRRLVNASAPEFRPIVRAALLTGCRYGELAALNAGDFNPDSGTLHIRQSKNGHGRHIVLTDEGAELFEGLSAGRAADAPMLPRKDGKRWGKSHQARPLKEACQRAKVDISFHELRHTYASLAIMKGLELLPLARNLGHGDTRMVEKHYGHLTESYVAKRIRATAPRFGNAITASSNVTVVGSARKQR
ncbi:MAG TPA: site-specific integrase [Kiloniellaceae bacterium]|nr:site-specific integrase [Kiloniellaceae bacterium]